jgi:two-component system phosphate regulon sensor histidine kinase PhoR
MVAIAVRGADFFRRVEKERSSRNGGKPAFHIGIGGSGDLLGEGLPGLRVQFESAAEVENLRGLGLQRLFLLSLVLVLGLTGLSGYLVSRDVRRELRVVELRSQFVSSVSHELRTPLTSIRLYAETLQMRSVSSNEPDKEYLDIIVSESERLTRLLDNVLDFSRIERGQKTYDLQSTSLLEVINACVHTMQYLLAEEGFQLRVTANDDIPPVQADRDALEQAILNLLTNAMKYSGKSREIHLRLSCAGATAIIEVADYGLGIPLGEQRRIFEKFYRVPLQEDRSIPGAGLGLALVDHIAKAHGGCVSVVSSPGAGSTFSIRLPIPTGSCS